MDFGIPYFQANASIVIESRNYAWLMMIGYAAQYIGDCSENPLWGPHEATIRRNFLMAIDTAHMDPAGVRHQIKKYVPFKPPDRGLCCFLPWCQVDNTSTGDVLWFHGRPRAWPKAREKPPEWLSFQGEIDDKPPMDFWQPDFPTNPCRWKLTLPLRFGTLGSPEIFVL